MKASAIQELEEVTRRLIAFDTVSTKSNVAAAEYLANILEQQGFAVRVITEYVQETPKATVLAWIGPAEPDGLILSGHIDVVPFAGQPAWKTDPLVLHNDGQRIFGRGVSDMKAFLAQVLSATAHQDLTKLKKPLLCIFTYDEEIGGQGAKNLGQTLPSLLREVPVPKVALIGEPTNFDILTAHKGYASFDISIRGKGGHSSAPDNGLNAIQRMAEVIDLIQQANSELRTQVTSENATLFPDIPYAAFNYGVINGGLAPNMIAEQCHLTMSLRMLPGQTASSIAQPLREKIEQIVSSSMKAIDVDCGVTIGNFLEVPALRSPQDGAFCDLLGRVMHRPVGHGAAFATDGGHFQRLGIHSYICGPGLISEAHQPNESLPLTNFMSGVEKLETIIYDWCIK